MFYVFDPATDATIAGPFLDHMDAEERAMAYEAEGRQVETGFISEPGDEEAERAEAAQHDPNGDYYTGPTFPEYDD